jgi:DNA-binding transcriptional MerR regulator
VFCELCILSEETLSIFNLNNPYERIEKKFRLDTDLAIKYYRKALEIVPKDTTTDKDLLERVKQGAEEKLKELEAKKRKDSA